MICNQKWIAPLAFAAAIFISSCSGSKTENNEQAELNSMDSTSAVLKDNTEKLEDQTKKVEESLEKTESEFENAK